MFEDDDDEESVDALYADGTWEWNDKKNELEFVSFQPAGASKQIFTEIPAAVIGSIEFNDDMDIVEQQKIRKRIQRKTNGDDGIVTLQDLKDFVLYTAPVALLTPMIIDILHTCVAERFLRGLILYCQYYAQIAELMANRTSALEKKIRLSHSDKIEAEYQENISDLRLLVTKEYCSMILGAGDFNKFHHKGIAKTRQSMSRRETMVFEPLIVISVQIVWIALARKNYQQIELEVNRLLRSKAYNIVERNKNIDAEAVMSEEEKKVLRGPCLKSGRSLLLHSPLFDEIRCDRDVDFRLLALGVMNMQGLNERLQHLERYLTLDESQFQDRGISLGIIGLDRNRFDIRLKEVQRESSVDTQSSQQSDQSGQGAARRSISRPTSTASRVSTYLKKNLSSRQPIFREIVLPKKITESQPLEFPSQTRPPLRVNLVQRHRWMMRVSRFKMHKKLR